MKNLTAFETAIIKALAKNDLKIARTADDLHYHQNSVRYQIHRIINKTGLDPRKFYDLVELLKM